jgi:hypothetical protein
MSHSGTDDPTIYYEWQKGNLETRQTAIEKRRNELLQIDLATDRPAQQVTNYATPFYDGCRPSNLL